MLEVLAYIVFVVFNLVIIVGIVGATILIKRYDRYDVVEAAEMTEVEKKRGELITVLLDVWVVSIGLSLILFTNFVHTFSLVALFGGVFMPKER